MAKCIIKVFQLVQGCDDPFNFGFDSNWCDIDHQPSITSDYIPAHVDVAGLEAFIDKPAGLRDQLADIETGDVDQVQFKYVRSLWVNIIYIAAGIGGNYAAAYGR